MSTIPASSAARRPASSAAAARASCTIAGCTSGDADAEEKPTDVADVFDGFPALLLILDHTSSSGQDRPRILFNRSTRGFFTDVHIHTILHTRWCIRSSSDGERRLKRCQVKASYDFGVLVDAPTSRSTSSSTSEMFNHVPPPSC